MFSTSETMGSGRLIISQLIETMEMGGAEQLAVRIANRLASDGHQSHLIVLRGPGVLSPRIAPEVRVHYLGYSRSSVINLFRFALSLKRGYRLLGDIVRAERIDLLQSHLPGSNFFGLLLGWRRVCAVLATVHNNQEFRYGDDDNPILMALRKAAYRQILRRTEGVVAVSDEVRRSLVAQLGLTGAIVNRIRVLANAVPEPTPIGIEDAESLRGEMGCGPTAVFILAAGRFCEQKNFGDLLPAAASMRDSGVDFRLVVAGDGEQRSRFQDEIVQWGLESKVSAPGNLNHLEKVMQAADVFVMPSLWEGLPLVLLEAMASGLPVVAYGIPGVEDVVVDGESGLLGPVGSPEGLASRLSALAADHGLRRSMGVAARAEIRRRFGFDKFIATLVDYYTDARSSFAKRSS